MRKRAKDYLVNRLAWYTTLSQFYRLLNLIEEQVGHYFEHLTDDWTAPPRDREAAAPCPEPEAIDGEALRRALSRLSLPLEGKRKLTFETLWDVVAVAVAAGSGCWILRSTSGSIKRPPGAIRTCCKRRASWNTTAQKANRVRYAVAPAFRAEPEKMLPS